ncbi:hypothetical protein HXX76_001691 [Chlamydomonas incerta]|uniref:U6 snRNA phosphodiesterase 1 n=1 Tax=Chlamydomonas incerta TaxID=51695 RepID=A0A835WCL9_CHLIN|nr:hypothetical protein HXX76_001691 [Chlamydomonas incerta]|eukprot:KAG2444955.1 hypothetical protein HXX76_001691 [Chlamydomonas incerta]
MPILNARALSQSLVPPTWRDPTALLAAASGDELHGLLAPGARVAVAVAAAGAGAAAAVAGALVAPGPAAAAASASASAQPPPQIQIQDPAPPLDPYGGRVRRFPHVVGNYATVVLLPVQGLALEGPLDALYRKLRRLLPDLEPTTQQQQPAAAAAAGGALAGGRGRGAGGGGREAAAPCNGGYHVSLSRPVPITRAQIEPLTSELSRRLAAAGSSFPLSLCGLRAFVNDEGTRSFVSAMVAAGERRVVGLVRAVDGAFAAHGLPTFYEDPLPHVSVGWLVGDQRARIQAAVDKFNKQHQQAPAKAHSRPAAGAAEPGAAGAAGSRDAAAGAQPPGAAAFSLGPWQASRAVCVVGQREYEVWRAAAPPPTTRGGTGGGTEG